MKKILISAFATLVMTACAGPSGYGPVAGGNGYGYTDQQIEADRFRVTFRASSGAAADDGALRRAAELTLQNGGDWFRVIARGSENDARRSRGPSIGIGGATGGRNSSVGVGVQLPLGGASGGDVTARLEFLIGQGERPEGPDYYRARDVLARLGGLAVGQSGLSD